MDEQNNFNKTMLKDLKQINKRLSELTVLQRKVATGYEYINATELADLLGESVNTIYNRVHKRDFPYYKPKGKLLFKLNEIRDWIESERHSSIKELKESI